MSLQQKITAAESAKARAEVKLQKLRKAERALETRRKVVVGGYILSEALNRAETREWFQRTILPRLAERDRTLFVDTALNPQG